MQSLYRRKVLGWLAASPLIPSAWSQNVFDIEREARAVLPPDVSHWIASGAEGGLTVDANLAGFREIALRARRLVDVANVDTTVTLLGARLPHPVLLAPVGNLDFVREGGDLLTVRAATAANAIWMAPSLSNASIEEIAAAGTAARWFQLYPLGDYDMMRAVLDRVANAGCSTVAVTVDSPVMGQREPLRDSSVTPRPRIAPRLGNFSAPGAAAPRIGNATLDWRFIDWLQANTRMNVVLKGIMTAEDAKLARRAGVQGLVVSNHGGRQEESGQSTIGVLAEIRDAAGSKLTIVLDGGIRRGTDVFKAIALGADAVAIGRPYLWGLGASGEAGVLQVVDLLRRELVRTMQLAGAPRISSIGPASVRSAA